MNWPSVPFGEVFEIQLGKMLDKQKNTGELRPYLANRNVRWGECDVSNLPEMRFTESDRTKFDLRKGDLLVCEGGEVGRTAIWNDELEDCYYQKAIHRLRPKADVEPRFVLHYMRLAAERDLFARLTSSTSIAHLTKAKLQKVTLPLPPLAEQKRIAGILDAADALRAKRRESLAQLDTLLESTFLTLFGDPVTNPMGWEVLPLKELLAKKSINGAYYPKDAYSSSGTPMVHMANAFYGVVDLSGIKRVNASLRDIEKYGLRSSDVLISRRSLVYEGSAKPCLIPETNEPLIFESSLIRVRPDQKKVLTIFLFHYLQNDRARAKYVFPLVTRSTISGINQSNLMKVNVLVPPLDLQNRFATIVESIEQQKALQRAHLAELDALFASLQSRAFNGEL